MDHDDPSPTRKQNVTKKFAGRFKDGHTTTTANSSFQTEAGEENATFRKKGEKALKPTVREQHFTHATLTKTEQA